MKIYFIIRNTQENFSLTTLPKYYTETERDLYLSTLIEAFGKTKDIYMYHLKEGNSIPSSDDILTHFHSHLI